MLDGERREKILDLLRRDIFARVVTISSVTGASETTVRRDLVALETEGSIRRIRGGAELAPTLRRNTDPPREAPFEMRRAENTDQKRNIAKYAVSLCENGETIFIDGGSTTFRMAEYLTPRRLTIVTNSFAIAEALLRTSANTIIVPAGIVYPESYLILDPFGNEIFRDYQASKVFMGIGGLTSAGAFNNDAQLIRTERVMIEHAEELIVLADASKFGRSAPMRLCDLEAIDTLVTDQPPPVEIVGSLRPDAVRVTE